jgi:hypothetical protein
MTSFAGRRRSRSFEHFSIGQDLTQREMITAYCNAEEGGGQRHENLLPSSLCSSTSVAAIKEYSYVTS